jgi:hypothetical protein
MTKWALLFFLIFASWSVADISLKATFGSLLHRSDFNGPHLDLEGSVYYQFDQQTFVGITSGYQKPNNEVIIPLLASAFVRLPLGGKAMPLISGDVGFATGDVNAFMWRAGGGIDLKNGDRSSLLLLVGFQQISNHYSSYYIRGGLLLEF